ncbi:UvrABC system protein B [Methanolapillus ohkumae]|uniref:UvrABC system protein B n=1 Tax=Methanolapillus ohkumae TaxID=3028298 RepID=A0AA96VGV7_9EURY|nr:UvrABC system protein B [Methanosarcinaceae archaeon Am2]
MEETQRRRNLQLAFNAEHGIVPQTIRKPIREKVADISDIKSVPKANIPGVLIEYEAEMNLTAEMLDFERAIQLRDTIRELERKMKGEETDADKRDKRKAEWKEMKKAEGKEKKKAEEGGEKTEGKEKKDVKKAAKTRKDDNKNK